MNVDQKQSSSEAPVSFGHAQPIQKSMILDLLEELLPVAHLYRNNPLEGFVGDTTDHVLFKSKSFFLAKPFSGLFSVNNQLKMEKSVQKNPYNCFIIITMALQ
jgi:hypothetical protein